MKIICTTVIVLVVIIIVLIIVLLLLIIILIIVRKKYNNNHLRNLKNEKAITDEELFQSSHQMLPFTINAPDSKSRRIYGKINFLEACRKNIFSRRNLNWHSLSNRRKGNDQQSNV